MNKNLGRHSGERNKPNPLAIMSWLVLLIPLLLLGLCFATGIFALEPMSFLSLPFVIAIVFLLTARNCIGFSRTARRPGWAMTVRTLSFLYFLPFVLFFLLALPIEGGR